MREQWSFTPVYNNGHIDRVDGLRRWPDGWVDGIRILGPDDVVGIRVVKRQAAEIVWEQTGSLETIVNQLLELPPPGNRLAPYLATGRSPLAM